jgi:cell division protease FtsH
MSKAMSRLHYFKFTFVNINLKSNKTKLITSIKRMVLWFKKSEPEIQQDKFSLGQILLFAWLFLIVVSKLRNNTQGSFFSLTVKNKKDQDEIKNDALKNVVGLESVKEEIRYYIDLIKNKESFKQWNVKLPKGILLAGPPGTGKTLLVKTIAKSLNVPVISCSGSSFVEIYVGVGSKRIREVFTKAREYDNCIIFIDEIDAIGGKRNMHNNSERASTLNQLLVEMDGFNDETGIIVFAATNLVKNLDSALLRSGRFDKKIYFDLPNFFERKQLFELYFKDIQIPRRLSYDVLADRSAGITGADIANIANQSKMNAIQSNKKNVCLSEKDIQVAIDEVMIGREKRERMLGAEERERVAHHEAGHAFMGYILKNSEPPVKVSIIPRGEAALGFSQPKPENKMLYIREAILTKICVLLGGRCAIIIFQQVQQMI